MHVNKICCNGNSINLTVENVKKDGVATPKSCRNGNIMIKSKFGVVIYPSASGSSRGRMYDEKQQ